MGGVSGVVVLAARAVLGWQVVAAALVLAGLVVAEVVEATSRGRDLVGWAVVLGLLGVLVWLLAG